MEFLRSHGLYYTSIDAPDDPAIVPSFIAATGDQAYVRFHGKNRDNWLPAMALPRSGSNTYMRSASSSRSPKAWRN